MHRIPKPGATPSVFSATLPAFLALLAIPLVGCSDSDGPTPPPVPTRIELGWVEATVGNAPGGGFEYSFEWTADVDVPDSGNPTFEWTVERLTPTSRVFEIERTSTADTRLLLPEPGSLEEEALLLLTVDARIGEVTSNPISHVYGRGQIGPRSRILAPSFESGRGTTSLPLVMRWDAYDTGEVLANSPAAPSGFGCKIIDLPDPFIPEEALIALVETGSNLLITEEESSAWTSYSPETREATHPHVFETSFAVATRALDAEGQPETWLQIGRNLSVCTFLPTEPPLVTFESGSEVFRYPIDPIPEIRLPEGTPFELKWNTPLFVRYLAPADPEDPTVLGDWAWRTELDESVVLGDAGSITRFWLAVRMGSNDPSSERLLEFRIHVISP